MAVEELLAANPSITDPNRIAVGDVISVPVRSVGTVIRIDGPDYRHLRLGESADLVAIASPQLANEVVHWQVAEADAEPPAWGPGQEWRYADGPSFDAAGRSSTLAEWPNSQRGHVWRAYRALVEASAAHPELWTQTVVVEWGSTGPCPAEEVGYVEPPSVAPDGTVYATVPGEDAEYNSRWTLVATNTGGTPGADWRHALESCWEPYELVVGKDATVYLSASYRAGAAVVDLPWKLIVAGPEGVRSERELAWAALDRAPDGTVFSTRMEVNEDGPYEPTFRSMTIAALGPDGHPRPGWPYTTTTDLTSWPVYGPDGAVYLAQTTDAGDWIIALGPDGKVKEGWPYAVPGELKWTVCGAGCANVPDNPQVAADGTVYDSFDSGIYAVGPDGQAKEGWPYVLPKGTSIPSACRGQLYGCPPFDPVMADDGRVYVPRYDERSGAPHDDLVCLTPGGTLCPGWPVRLPGATDDFEIDERGNVKVSLGEPENSSQTKITVRHDGTIVE
jgi:hypothetical protein